MNLIMPDANLSMDNADHIYADHLPVTKDGGTKRAVVYDHGSKGGPKKLKNYFHGICLSCHKSMKKAKIATGPTKFNHCHKRE